MSPLQSRDFGLDADRASGPEPLPAALRRRLGGRYPVDPFGLDPQLADLVHPMAAALVRVVVSGGEHVPDEGPAVLVVNRGLGIVEPLAVALSVRRATSRRLRVVGAPALPVVAEVARRLGAVASSPEDVASVLRAGHLVAVPLAPTWLRTGAGTPPLALMRAMTHAPVIPVAVVPGGPLHLPVRPWRVRFGAPVTIDEPYSLDDPLTAARLAEAVRDSVEELLALR